MIPITKIHSNTQNIEAHIYRKPGSFSIPKEKSHEFTLTHRTEQAMLSIPCTLQLSRVLGKSARQTQPKGRLWIFQTLFGAPSRRSLLSSLAVLKSLNAQCSLWVQGALFSILFLDSSFSLDSLCSILCHWLFP